MRHSGFTLIELLVTIAVMTIVATIAVPGFQGMMASNRLAADYNEILAGLNMARSEAIKRRETVDFLVMTPAKSGYQIKIDEEVLRERSLESAITGLEKVSFNNLGRAPACGCVITIEYSGEEKKVNVSSFGRVGRGSSS